MDIRIENLTKTYGNLNAVDHMNLNIKDGELVATEVEEEAKEVLEENLPADQSFEDDNNEGGDE